MNNNSIRQIIQAYKQNLAKIQCKHNLKILIINTYTHTKIYN